MDLLIWIFGFLTGVCFVLVCVVYGAIKLTNIYQGVDLPKPFRLHQYGDTSLPKILRDYLSSKCPEAPPNNEFVAVNCCLMFLFQEMKNSDRLRSWFEGRLNREFNDVLHTKSLKYVVRDLRVKSFNLGSCLPVLDVIKVSVKTSQDDTRIEDSRDPCATAMFRVSDYTHRASRDNPAGSLMTVVSLQLHETVQFSGHNIHYQQNVEVIADIDYTNGIELVIEVLMSFERNIDLLCKILKMKGRVRFHLTRKPYTNWSVCFVDEPLISLDINSTINGKNVPQVLIPVIANQIRKMVRRKHTFPNFKMRRKPFFQGMNYQPSPGGLNAAPTVNTSCQLAVTVVCCSRLRLDAGIRFKGLYCLLYTDSIKYHPKLPYKEHRRIVSLSGSGRQRLEGLSIKSGVHVLLQTPAVWVDKVKPASLAAKADIKKNDVFTEINGVNVFDNESTVRRLLSASDTGSVNVVLSTYQPVKFQSASAQTADIDNSNGGEKIERPGLDINKELNNRNPQKTSTPSGYSVKEDRSRRRISCVTSDSVPTSRHYKTMSVNITNEPSFNERYKFKLLENDVFLNILVFGHWIYGASNQPEDRNNQQTVSVSLHDVVSRCQTAPQKEMQFALNLVQPPDTEPFLPPAGVRGFEADKSNGDVILKAQLLTQHQDTKRQDEREASDVEDLDLVDFDLVEPVSGNSQLESTAELQQHKFIERTFNQAVMCNYCMRKIWMKRAMHCPVCSMIVHKKCVGSCIYFTNCQLLTTTNSSNSRQLRNDETELGKPDSSLLTEFPRSRRARLMEKLRWRRNKKNDNSSSNMEEPVLNKSASSEWFVDDDFLDATSGDATSLATDDASNTISSSSSDEETDLELSFMKEYRERLDNPLDMYDHDEHMITAAKQYGKELYSSLDLEERKQVLEAMINKFQTEIERVSEVRDDLQKSLNSSPTAVHRQTVERQLEKANSKLQSLAVTLLHYFSGLQDCADQHNRAADIPDSLEHDRDNGNKDNT